MPEGKYATVIQEPIYPDLGVTFDDVIEFGLVDTLFQPIIDLRTMDVMGFEALSRGPVSSPWYSPLALIEEAGNRNMLWKLELLFRTCAISRARDAGLQSLLFLNVDPNVMKDPKFHEGLTRQVVMEHGMDPGKIVFEITERSAIGHFEQFQSAIDHYRSQGYRIAIDDMGAGYSNLNAICHIHPHFIKVDMALIRGIDQDSFKQAIVKSFVVLANLTGSKLIAEGIETMEEAKTLISIGVHAGQGYLLARPAPGLSGMSHEVETALKFLVRSGTVLHAFNPKLIGEIAQNTPTVDKMECCANVKRVMDKAHYEGVSVTDAGKVVGLVMRNRLNESLSNQYGYALFAQRPISKLMTKATLMVEHSTPIGAVTELALSREGEAVYDNIVVSRNGKYSGMVSVVSLLRHAMEIERSYALELNPLTGLPGNVQINRVLLETIRNGMETGVLYFDLDNFKCYNDLYGFEKGDGIIKMLKGILCDVIKSGHSCASFVGHIGGDDFIAVLTCGEEECAIICKEILRRFDVEVMDWFSSEHRLKGYFSWRDQQEREICMPLTSLSIAGTYGSMSGFDSPETLACHMAVLKKMAKSVTGSCWVMETAETGILLTDTGKSCDMLSAASRGQIVASAAS